MIAHVQVAQFSRQNDSARRYVPAAGTYRLARHGGKAARSQTRALGTLGPSDIEEFWAYNLACDLAAGFNKEG